VYIYIIYHTNTTLLNVYKLCILQNYVGLGRYVAIINDKLAKR